jgi:hypothetical protein
MQDVFMENLLFAAPRRATHTGAHRGFTLGLATRYADLAGKNNDFVRRRCAGDGSRCDSGGPLG